MSKFFKNKKAISVATILIFSLIYELICFYQYYHSDFFGILMPDEAVYHKAAQDFLKLGSFGADTQNLSLFYIHWIALIYKLFGVSYLPVRIFNIIFHSLSAFLCYRLTKKIFNFRTATISLLIFVFYKPFSFYSITYIKESYNILLVLIFTNLLFEFFQKKKIFTLLLSSATLSVLFFSRPNAWVLLPAMLIGFLFLYFQKHLRLKESLLYSLVSVLGVFLIAFPIALHNKVTHGEFTITGNVVGYNLYAGNTDLNPSPYWAPLYFAQGNHASIKKGWIKEARKRSSQDLSLSEASKFWIKQTVKEFSIEKFAKKIWASFSSSEYCENFSITYLTDFIPALYLNFNFFGIILILAIPGIYLSLRGNSYNFIIAVMVLFYFTTLLLLFPNSRYRLPVTVLLIPYSAYFLTLFSTKMYKKYILVLFLSILTFIPIVEASDISHMLNIHGNYHMKKGRVGQAIEVYKRSVSVDGTYSDYSRISLAHIFIDKGDFKQAFQFLQPIKDTSLGVESKKRLMRRLLEKK